MSEHRRERNTAEPARPWREAAEDALSMLNDLDRSIVAALEEPLRVIEEQLTRAAAGIRDSIRARVQRLGASELYADELPNTSANIRTYRATLTCRMIARRAARARLDSLHPAGSDTRREHAAERYEALVSAAWNAYLAAHVAATAGDLEAALHHLQTARSLVETLRAGLEQITHREHRHRPRRALAPPGRRCAAHHYTAQAPPRALACHVPAQVAHGSESPPG